MAYILLSSSTIPNTSGNNKYQIRDSDDQTTCQAIYSIMDDISLDIEDVGAILDEVCPLIYSDCVDCQ